MKAVNGLKNTKVPSCSGFLTTLFRYHWMKRQNKKCYNCVIHSARGQNKKRVQNFLWEILHVKHHLDIQA